MFKLACGGINGLSWAIHFKAWNKKITCLLANRHILPYKSCKPSISVLKSISDTFREAGGPVRQHNLKRSEWLAKREI